MASRPPPKRRTSAGRSPPRKGRGEGASGTGRPLAAPAAPFIDFGRVFPYWPRLRPGLVLVDQADRSASRTAVPVRQRVAPPGAIGAGQSLWRRGVAKAGGPPTYPTVPLVASRSAHVREPFRKALRHIGQTHRPRRPLRGGRQRRDARSAPRAPRSRRRARSRPL